MKWLKCLCTLQRNKDAVKGNYYIVKNYCSEKYLNCEIAQTISMATPIRVIIKRKRGAVRLILAGRP